MAGEEEMMGYGAPTNAFLLQGLHSYLPINNGGMSWVAQANGHHELYLQAAAQVAQQEQQQQGPGPGQGPGSMDASAQLAAVAAQMQGGSDGGAGVEGVGPEPLGQHHPHYPGHAMVFSSMPIMMAHPQGMVMAVDAATPEQMAAAQTLMFLPGGAQQLAPMPHAMQLQQLSQVAHMGPAATAAYNTIPPSPFEAPYVSIGGAGGAARGGRQPASGGDGNDGQGRAPPLQHHPRKSEQGGGAGGARNGGGDGGRRTSQLGGGADGGAAHEQQRGGGRGGPGQGSQPAYMGHELSAMMYEAAAQQQQQGQQMQAGTDVQLIIENYMRQQWAARQASDAEGAGQRVLHSVGGPGGGGHGSMGGHAVDVSRGGLPPSGGGAAGLPPSGGGADDGGGVSPHLGPAHIIAAATAQKRSAQLTKALGGQAHQAAKARPEPAIMGFDDYQKRYGAAVKCERGMCAVKLDQPCKDHKCVCCKVGRQVVQYSRQGWCGPCGKREVVSGLKFVRCGRCKAEMLEETYRAHLKQNVTVTDASGNRMTGRCRDYEFEEVDTDKGRRCGKCTNMRPLTFYASEDTNCSCNMHVSTRVAPDKAAPAIIIDHNAVPGQLGITEPCGAAPPLTPHSTGLSAGGGGAAATITAAAVATAPAAAAAAIRPPGATAGTQEPAQPHASSPGAGGQPQANSIPPAHTAPPSHAPSSLAPAGILPPPVVAALDVPAVAELGPLPTHKHLLERIQLLAVHMQSVMQDAHAALSTLHSVLDGSRGVQERRQAAAARDGGTGWDNALAAEALNAAQQLAGTSTRVKEAGQKVEVLSQHLSGMARVAVQVANIVAFNVPTLSLQMFQQELQGRAAVATAAAAAAAAAGGGQGMAAEASAPPADAAPLPGDAANPKPQGADGERADAAPAPAQAATIPPQGGESEETESDDEPDNAAMRVNGSSQPGAAAAAAGGPEAPKLLPVFTLGPSPLPSVTSAGLASGGGPSLGPGALGGAGGSGLLPTVHSTSSQGLVLASVPSDKPAIPRMSLLRAATMSSQEQRKRHAPATWASTSSAPSKVPRTSGLGAASPGKPGDMGSSVRLLGVQHPAWGQPPPPRPTSAGGGGKDGEEAGAGSGGTGGGGAAPLMPSTLSLPFNLTSAQLSGIQQGEVSFCELLASLPSQVSS